MSTLFFVESNCCGCHSHGFSKVWSVDKSTNTQYNSVHHNIFVNDKLFQSIYKVLNDALIQQFLLGGGIF